MQAHEDLVEDVAWHLKDDNIFGSVGDDCKLMMWDLRTNKPEQSIAAHQKEVGLLQPRIIKLYVEALMFRSLHLRTFCFCTLEWYMKQTPKIYKIMLNPSA